MDPSQVIGASELATKLILELAGGRAEKEIVVFGETAEAPPNVPLDAEKCREVLGHHLKNQEMFEILEKLKLKKITEKQLLSILSLSKICDPQIIFLFLTMYVLYVPANIIKFNKF